MIVDLMRNDLGRVCTYGSIEAPRNPQPEPHPGLWHLVSRICGRLRPETGDGELLRATFPPGSVTGAPKVQAMRVIAELERTGREAYTGAIGFISPQAGLELSVAIRTFEFCEGQLWLGAGGAIVADSDPARELEEALVKARPLAAAIHSRVLVEGGRDAVARGCAPNPVNGHSSKSTSEPANQVTRRASVAWADAWLGDREQFGMSFGLHRMRRLMRALGDPHRSFRSIHVVGTNGKSSTTRMTAAILERHGLRTGAYLSPHLQSFAERVEVAELGVTPERFAAVVERVAMAVDRLDANIHPNDRVTQFEALTAAAYLELAERGVEVAIVEAGLGGRLDATSVIASDVQVLTNVGLEHTAVLGDTHTQIAAEKLAVVPHGGVLVIGAEPHHEAERLARLTVSSRGARLARGARHCRRGVGSRRISATELRAR